MKIVFICTLLVYFYFVMYKSKKYMHMLQQNWYDDGFRYIKWIIDNFNKVFVNSEILFLLFFFLKGYTLIIFFAILYPIINNLYISISIYKIKFNNNSFTKYFNITIK